MLHGLTLPETVIGPLHDMISLQMKLLSSAIYGISSKDPTLESERATYIEKLEEYPDLVGRGKKLASWIFASKERTTFLCTFARSLSSTQQQKEQERKFAWCQQLTREIDMFLDRKQLHLSVKNFFGDDETPNLNEKNAPEWKRAGRSFFIYFYENYLGSSGSQFPQVLSSDPTQRFGRDAFLQAVLQANKEVEICPMCDQTYYYTHSSDNRKIFTSLDHFLPKSHYPHFSCHPYNLVPICHRCNSSEKAGKDPFLDQNEQRRAFLKKSSLPYSGIDLSKVTYLKVDVRTPGVSDSASENQSNTPKNHIPLGPLLLRDKEEHIQTQQEAPAWSHDELQEAIDMLSDLYGIPDHWGTPVGSNRIRATLFRRMRQFLGDGKGGPLGPDSPSQIHNLLHLLLYYLDQEYHQKDPHAFAMTWMLAAFMNEHTQRLVDKKPDEVARLNDPFLEEIMSWYGQSVEKNDERAKRAAGLLEIAKRSINGQNES